MNEKREVEEISSITSRFVLLMGKKEIEEVEVLAVETGLKEGSSKMRKICMCLYTEGKNLVKGEDKLGERISND